MSMGAMKTAALVMAGVALEDANGRLAAQAAKIKQLEEELRRRDTLAPQSPRSEAAGAAQTCRYCDPQVLASAKFTSKGLPDLRTPIIQ
jgi:hypothetical protein